MSDWREGYRTALMKFICKNGAPRYERGYYSWVGDYASVDHTRRCGVVAVNGFDVSEETISVFAGTFDSDQQTTLLTTTVSCNCGKYTRIPWAYEGSMTSVLLGLLKTDDTED